MHPGLHHFLYLAISLWGQIENKEKILLISKKKKKLLKTSVTGEMCGQPTQQVIQYKEQ